MKHGFRFRILLLSLLAMCIMDVLIGVTWYSITAKEAQKSTEKYIGTVLEQSNETFETMLKDIDHVVTSASINQVNVIDVLRDYGKVSSAEQLENNQKIQALMMSLYQFKSYMTGLMISTQDGKYYHVGSMLPYNQLKEQPWFTNVDMHGKKSVLLPPQSNGSDMVISIARNVTSGKRQLGVVKADINVKLMEDCFVTGFKEIGDVFIFDKDSSKVIYPLNEVKDNSMIDEIVANNEKMSGETGSFYIRADSNKYLLIYQYSEYTNWISVGIVPEKYVTREFQSVSLMAVVMSTGMGLGMLLILYLLLSVQVNRLTLLCNAVSNIKQDELVLDPVTDTDDEIGILQNQIIAFVDQIRQLISDVRQQQKEKRSLEMKMLQNQINPHFLHNTLNTIKYLAVLQNADNIAEVTDSLSVLLQNNMCNDEYITLSKEEEILRSYLKIQIYKYSNKFVYQIAIEEELKDTYILKMLLQPFLENAIKHGIAPMDGMGIVTIKIFQMNEKLNIVIRDNGVGMLKEQCYKLTDPEEKSDRIGVHNVCKRIQLHYGNEYGVEIYSVPGETSVEIKLPVIWNNPEKITDK